MKTPVGPEDDPRFEQWAKDVGPMRELPELPEVQHVGRPVVVGVSILIGLAVAVVALGWGAFAYAASLGVVPVAAISLMALGTVMIGGATIYLIRSRRHL